MAIIPILIGNSSATITFHAYQAYGEQLEMYDGTVNPLSVEGREGMAGVSIGDYALFAGGYTYPSHYNRVDVYNSDLTKGSNKALSQAKSYVAGAKNDNYAMIAGGYNDNGALKTVNAFDSELVRTNATGLQTERQMICGISFGQYAIFAGGHKSNYYTSDADIYDENMTRIIMGFASASLHMGTANQSYAIIAGSIGGNHSDNSVTGINEDLTIVSVPNMSSLRANAVCATAGNYMICAGGTYWNGNSGSGLLTVDAYDNALTRTRAPNLKNGVSEYGSISFGNYALFKNGYTEESIDTYDADLKRTNLPLPWPSSYYKNKFAGAAVGKYAIFAGGTGVFMSNSLCVYGLVPVPVNTIISIPPNAEYQFDGDVQRTSLLTEITLPNPATGYVKIKNASISGA